MVVPTGILSSSKVLPILISASDPDIIFDPSLSPFGAIMYRLSPSSYKTRAMKADLFGSYSILSTAAGIPSLFLLKSIIL